MITVRVSNELSEDGEANELTDVGVVIEQGVVTEWSVPPDEGVTKGGVTTVELLSDRVAMERRLWLCQS